MRIETDRLVIRELESTDEKSFVKMASDGSLKDIGFDTDCNMWMKGWIVEAKELTDKDDPTTEYLAYTIQLKHSGIVVGSVGCSYYDDLDKVGITGCRRSLPRFGRKTFHLGKSLKRRAFVCWREKCIRI